MTRSEKTQLTKEIKQCESLLITYKECLAKSDNSIRFMYLGDWYTTRDIENLVNEIEGLKSRRNDVNRYDNLTQGPQGAVCWVITLDIAERVCEKSRPEQVKRIKADGFTEHFKMYDSEGHLHYTGYLNPDLVDSNKGWYRPLDEYGFKSGCTEIKYKTNGKYETL